jgi:hypothetical protein
MLMLERSKEASALAEGGLERIKSLGGAIQEPGFLRALGYADMQDGNLAGAETALKQSLSAAREREAQFEVAQTLDALARLAELRGDPADAPDSEARAIFGRLRVTAVPKVPVRQASPRVVDA